MSSCVYDAYNTAVLLHFQKHVLLLFFSDHIVGKQRLCWTASSDTWTKNTDGVQYVRACHQMKLILKNACYDCF